MDPSWVPPEEDFVKINVHFNSAEVPNLIGNLNGVGSIVRDGSGSKLWGGAGPMPGMTEVQAIIWAFQEDETERIISRIPIEQNRTAEYMARYGMENVGFFVETLGFFGNLEFFLDRDMGLDILFEVMDNMGLGEVIDEEIVDEEEVEVERVENLDEEMAGNDEEEMNGGVEEEMFGGDEDDNFYDFWDLVCPNAEMQVGPPEPQGKKAIIPAPCSVKRPLLLKDKVDPIASPPGCMGTSSQRGNVISKGKEKLYSGFVFNDNGLHSEPAMHILDGGLLKEYSAVFEEEIIDLESTVWEGCKAKDLLEQAVKAWLARSSESSSSHSGQYFVEFPEDAMEDPLPEVDEELMDVTRMLVEWNQFVAEYS
ncbi:hypothetical protein ACET3Z_010978 [Daucus carota]